MDHRSQNQTVYGSLYFYCLSVCLFLDFLISQERCPSGCSGTQWRGRQRRLERQPRAWLQLLLSPRNPSTTSDRTTTRKASAEQSEVHVKNGTGDMTSAPRLWILTRLETVTGSCQSQFFLSAVSRHINHSVRLLLLDYYFILCLL